VEEIKEKDLTIERMKIRRKNKTKAENKRLEEEIKQKDLTIERMKIRRKNKTKALNEADKSGKIKARLKKLMEKNRIKKKSARRTLSKKQ